MVRPVTSQFDNASPGFAPERRQSPGLGVFATLNERAAPSRAQGLADALGVVANIANPVLQQKNLKEQAERANAGGAAAALNTVDAKRQAEDALYDKGVRQVVAERRVIDSLLAYQQHYEEGFDKTLGEAALAGDFETFAKAQMGDLINDPDMAKVVADRVLPFIQQLTGKHRAGLAKEFRDETIATAGDSIRMDLASGKATNPEEVMQRLRPILGKGGASKQYVDMIGALAIERHDASLIDRLIPEKWADGTPGPRSTPALAEAVNRARYAAENAAEAADREAKVQAHARIETSTIAVFQQAAGGDIVGAIKNLDALAATGTMTAAEYSARRNYIEGREDFANEQRYSPTALAEFRLKLAADPLAVTHDEVLAQVGKLFPRDRGGTGMAAQLLDDVTQTQKAALAAQANPTAKAYRSYLDAKYKPDAGISTPAEKDKYAGIMRAFDLEFAKSNDPEKARAAADVLINAMPKEVGKPSGSLKGDLKSLAAGTLSGTAFKQTHTGNTAADIRTALRKNEITEEEAGRALDALGL